MSNGTRVPQTGIKRASSAGMGGGIGTSLAAILIGQGISPEIAAALGAVVVGAVGALGKWARDQVAEGDKNPLVHVLSAIG
jgi:uncharacterized membrane protein YjjB (DUF3815 family)